MKKIIFFTALINVYFASKAQISYDNIDTLNHIGDVSRFSYFNYNNDDYVDIIYSRDNKLYLKQNIDGVMFEEDRLLLTLNELIIDIPDLADFNDDGTEDLVIVTYDSIHSFYRSQDGYSIKESFHAKSIYKSGVYLLDLDNDTALDLIYEDEGKIKVIKDFKNSSIDHSIEVKNYGTVEVLNYQIADVNNDNRLDIVALINDSIMFDLQNSDGSFRSLPSRVRNFSDFNIADVDNDDFNEIVFYSREAQSINRLSYSKNGRYETFDEMLLVPYYIPYSSYVNCVDLNQDGYLDVLNYSSFKIVYYEGDGEGSFETGRTIVQEFNGQAYYPFDVMDINNDSYLDILANGVRDTKSYYLNDELEIIDSRSHVFLPVVSAFKTADIDNNGGADYIHFARNGQVRIDWTSNNLAIDSTSTIFIHNGANQGFLYDLHHDGKIDIFYQIDKNNVQEVWMIGLNERGNLDEPHLFKNIASGSSEPEVIVKDGHEYLAFVKRVGDKVFWIDPSLADVDEYFNSTNYVSVSNGLKALAVSDLNSDNRQDIITYGFTSGTFNILLRNEADRFDILSKQLEGLEILHIKAEDYNNDEKVDLLIVAKNPYNYPKAQLIFVKNIGQDEGLLEVDYMVEFEITYSNFNMEYLDLNIDGDNEIILSSYLNHDVFKTDINGKYVLSTKPYFESTPYSGIAFIDLNYDGKSDLITCNAGGNIYYQLNNSVIEPSSLQTTLEVSDITPYSFKVTMNEVDYAGRVLIVSEGEKLTDLALIDSQFYDGASAFGEGSELADHAFVINAGNESEVQVEDLMPETEYYVYAVEYNLNAPQNSIINYSTDYASVVASTTVVTSISSNLMTNSIYPNPTESQLYVPRASSAKVYNLTGQDMHVNYNLQGSQLVLDVTELPNGLYLVDTGDKKQRFIKK